MHIAACSMGGDEHGITIELAIGEDESKRIERDATDEHLLVPVGLVVFKTTRWSEAPVGVNPMANRLKEQPAEPSKAAPGARQVRDAATVPRRE